MVHLVLQNAGRQYSEKKELVGSTVTMAAIVWCLTHAVRSEATHTFALKGIHCPNTNVSPCSSFPAHSVFLTPSVKKNMTYEIRQLKWKPR